MKIKNEKDFWSAVLFIVIGLVFAIGARHYAFGTAQQMGPAYLPTILGGLLTLIGVVVGLGSLGSLGKSSRAKSGNKSENKLEDKIDRMRLGPVAWLVGSVCLFAVLLKPAGLLVSLIVLIVASMLGSHEFKWKEAVMVSIVMVLIVWAVFIYGLNLTIPVWPMFIGR